MVELKVGDRVRVVRPSGKNLLAGLTGRIIDIGATTGNFMIAWEIDNAIYQRVGFVSRGGWFPNRFVRAKKYKTW